MVTDVPHSFAGHPQSIAELRSDKSRRADDWTPRDVLIDTLRDLDEGKISPDVLVVMFRDVLKNSTHSTGIVTASKCRFLTVGLMDLAKELFVRGTNIG